MRINIKATNLDLTPSLRTYIEEKLGPLVKFIKRFDEAGVAELWIEAARTTRHHRHGDVFMAEADLRLPKKVLRAAEHRGDVREAIDALKKTLKLEIDKYTTKMMERPVRARKRNVQRNV